MKTILLAATLASVSFALAAPVMAASTSPAMTFAALTAPAQVRIMRNGADDGAGHDKGDDHGTHGAGHDVGDDHGGAKGGTHGGGRKGGHDSARDIKERG